MAKALRVWMNGEAVGLWTTGWDRIDGDPLDDVQVARLLAAVTMSGSPEDDDDDFRFSIAGAQEKTALLWHDSRWHRPHGATPTTHILKLPLGLVGNLRADMRDSVDNEWLCAQLLQALGLSVATTSIGRFGAQRVLVVERFDRRVVGQEARTWIARLPQEDFCQATGTPPDRKYEADGGPTVVRCLDLLSGSTRAQDDRSAFPAHATRVLAAGSDRRARQELLAVPPARWRFPADATLRRVVGMADHRRGR
jgi:serine/threonine-protein kinase HipA